MSRYKKLHYLWCWKIPSFLRADLKLDRLGFVSISSGKLFQYFWHLFTRLLSANVVLVRCLTKFILLELRRFLLGIYKQTSKLVVSWINVIIITTSIARVEGNSIRSSFLLLSGDRMLTWDTTCMYAEGQWVWIMNHDITHTSTYCLGPVFCDSAS